MSHQPTVLVIENHHELCEAIAAVLDKKRPAIGSHAKSNPTAHLVHLDTLECVLVDARAPGIDVGVLLNALSEYDMTPPLVVIIGTDGVGADAVGATGVIELASGAEGRLRVVRDALGHQESRRHLADSVSTGIERTGELTPRQREVMSLVVDGLSSKQIAQRLGIAHRTVEVHRANLMKKMHVNSTAELIRTVLCGEREGFGNRRSKALDS